MPTYQYSCTDCGHFFEAVQSFSDDSLTVCPECEGKLRKVFNAVGVVFKGSGFYRTDSRTDSRGEKKSADTGSSSNGSGSTASEGSTSSSSTSSSTSSSASSSTAPTPA